METTGVTPIRKCKHCGIECFVKELLPMWFVSNSDSKYGYRNLCIPCKLKENKNNPKQKNWKTDHQTKKRYGIDAETYKQRMQSSDKCEICSSTKDLCYDHCHDTMKFRGILCRKCNRSLGQLGDTLDSILKVINYLKKDNP